MQSISSRAPPKSRPEMNRNRPPPPTAAPFPIFPPACPGNVDVDFNSGIGVAKTIRLLRGLQYSTLLEVSINDLQRWALKTKIVLIRAIVHHRRHRCCKTRLRWHLPPLFNVEGPQNLNYRCCSDWVQLWAYIATNCPIVPETKVIPTDDIE